MHKFVAKYHLNGIAIMSIGLGFIYYLSVGRLYGLTALTDKYFFAQTILVFLGYFVQSTWEAVSPFYVKERNEYSNGDRFYSQIILLNFISAIVVYLFFYIVVTLRFFDGFGDESFFISFMMALIPHNLFLMNKVYLNLNYHHKAYYYSDILYFLLATVLIYISSTGRVELSLVPFLSYVFVVIFQFFSMFLLNGFSFRLDTKKLSTIKLLVLSSSKMKLGSYMYGLKDIIIAYIFQSYGSGILSAYSYANKFSVACFQVINAPFINVYVARANELVVAKKIKEMFKELEGLITKTSMLFTVLSIIVGLCLPFIIDVLDFNNKWMMIQIYVIISIYNLVQSLSNPTGRTLSILRRFNTLLLSNVAFITVFIILVLMLELFNLQSELLLTSMLIPAQLALFIVQKLAIDREKIK